MADQQLGLEGLNVAVANLAAWRSDHEQSCSRRWAAAIVLLITNLLAAIGGLSTLLLTSHHFGG